MPRNLFFIDIALPNCNIVLSAFIVLFAFLLFYEYALVLS